MIRRPPRSTRTDTLFPYTTLFRSSEPAFADVRALSMAWSESTLAYLHQLSCEDPLTGLASLAHIRSRLSELYRGARAADETHALVVLDLDRKSTRLNSSH